MLPLSSTALQMIRHRRFTVPCESFLLWLCDQVIASVGKMETAGLNGMRSIEFYRPISGTRVIIRQIRCELLGSAVVSSWVRV